MHMTSNKVNFNKRKTVSFFFKEFFFISNAYYFESKTFVNPQ